MSKRSKTMDVTPDSPTFRVRYLGRRETFTARGKGCTQRLMQDMWDLGQAERDLERVEVTISLTGVRLARSGGVIEDTPMSAITYCSLDRAINKRMFSWVHSSGADGVGSVKGDGEGEVGKTLWCTAVVADTVQAARSMASMLAKVFHMAYKDHQCTRRSIVRRQTSKTASLLSLTPPASPRQSLSDGSTTNGGGHSAKDDGGSDGEGHRRQTGAAAAAMLADGERLNGVAEITIESSLLDDEQ